MQKLTVLPFENGLPYTPPHEGEWTSYRVREEGDGAFIIAVFVQSVIDWTTNRIRVEGYTELAGVTQRVIANYIVGASPLPNLGRLEIQDAP